jgi:hypothetical protein
MRLDPPTSTGGSGPGTNSRKPADPRRAAKQMVIRILH